MNSKEFKTIGRANISSNPMDRLPMKMVMELAMIPKKKLEHLFIDVHSHCFLFEHVPPQFMGLSFNLGDAVIDMTKFSLKATRKTVQVFGGAKKKRKKLKGKERLLSFFADHRTQSSIVDRQMSLLKKAYTTAYKTSEKQKPPKLILVQLMMDMESGLGVAKRGFYEQMKELSELRNIRNYDTIILPFLAVDPRRASCLKDFIAAFTPVDKKVNKTGQKFLDTMAPFFGVKLYPSLGYLPSDPTLMNIFKICEEKNIPVLSHCGGGNTHFFGKKIEGKYTEVDKNGNSKIKQYVQDFSHIKKRKNRMEPVAQFFNAPNQWIPVLKKFPKLKVILAHMGSDAQWKTFRTGTKLQKKKSHVRQSLDLMLKYKNVHCDFSYTVSVQENLLALKEIIDTAPADEKKIYLKKFLFGTDFFLSDLNKPLDEVVIDLLKTFPTEQLDRFCAKNPYRALFKETN